MKNMLADLQHFDQMCHSSVFQQILWVFVTKSQNFAEFNSFISSENSWKVMRINLVMFFLDHSSFNVTRHIAFFEF